MMMEASKCPKCGDEPHFVESVEKWYCYGCNSYVEDEESHEQYEDAHPAAATEEHMTEAAAEVHPFDQETSKVCAKCGAELEHIKDGKLFCFVCEAYPDEVKEDTKVAPTVEPKAEPVEGKTEEEAKALLETIPEPVKVESLVAPVIDAKPETPTIEPPAPKVETVDIKMCSTCGQPLKWIEKYQRHYCYGCRRYAQKGEVDKPAPALKNEEHDHKHCPDCNGELKFVEKYNEFYCFSCRKYPLREKKKVDPIKKNPYTCPKCNGTLKYIAKYERHYCTSCKEYAPKNNGQAEGGKKVCPTCRSEMKYVSEYNEWYCYKCKKYSLRPAKPVLLF
jgi:predicted RNA-binding Zn-ribbon protein involved in translation (DUF1610 family)/ssDNA-binding Zn-finger/Zn-ribbon topoisomerase 1